MRWPFSQAGELTCVRECRDCRDLLRDIMKDIQVLFIKNYLRRSDDD
jgi:hypothetical protein